VFEDLAVSGLEPLTLTRPAFALHCGAESLLRRQTRFFSAREVSAWVREEVAGLCRLSDPRLAVNDPTRLNRKGFVLVNARWLPPFGPPPDEVAFVLPPRRGFSDLSPRALCECLDEWRQALPPIAAGGWMVGAPWDLVQRNAEALAQDYLLWQAAAVGTAAGPQVEVVGPVDQVLIDRSARVEPLVLADTRRGPVLVDRDVVVEAFSRLEGPCYVGPGSHVSGARVCGSSIGPGCRVGGEVEMSILHGFCTKGREGLLSHSYLGEWADLGAGTRTGDPHGDGEMTGTRAGLETKDTSLLNVGVFVGDHTRTGAGTLLNAGAAVGPFCELLPWETLPLRRIPAFMQFGQGQLRERTDLRQVLTTAARAMGRRGCEWTEAHADCFLALYERTARQRRNALLEAEHRHPQRTV
jgi:hypothetical protein